MSGSSSKRRRKAARKPPASGAAAPAKKKTGATKKSAAKKAAKTAKKTTKRAAKAASKKTTKRAAKKVKTGAKKPARRTKPAKKTSAKKTSAKKTSAKKTSAKKTSAKKATVKKATVKKATLRKKAAKSPAPKRGGTKPPSTPTAPKTSKRTTRKRSKSGSNPNDQETMKKAAPTASPTRSRKKTSPKAKASTGSQPAPKAAAKSSAKARPKAANQAAAAAGSKKGKRKARTPREKKPRAPAKTMTAPKPVTTVLVEQELPDVRRARAANERRDGARGHLQPAAHDVNDGELATREPLDASLIMNTLAVDVQPKIEDNYDYSVLDEFRSSPHCPRPTRMVNSGCGGGEAAVYFAKLGFQCVGIDPDRGDVGLARERAWLAGVEIDFMVGGLFDTPNLLPAESFGLAVDRGAFYQIEDERERQRYLANIKRLLFRGGVFLLSAGFFPMGDGSRRPRGRDATEILLAREGGVVVNEMRQAGFKLLHRVLRQTADSGELGELVLFLRK